MSSTKKPKLGQNFLVDENACLRIADAVGDVGERTVVEIGPGHGAITELLAARCRRLHCIEFDPALARELAFRFRNDAHVTIHHADILATDLKALLGDAGHWTWWEIFRTTSRRTFLLHLFGAAREGVLARAVVMMQREVAERIAAGAGVERLRRTFGGDADACAGDEPVYAAAERVFAAAGRVLNCAAAGVCATLCGIRNRV
jgi:16S rRNA (adenine1518-N6/adenine1519-N6)-dimethyltransferase